MPLVLGGWTGFTTRHRFQFTQRKNSPFDSFICTNGVTRMHGSIGQRHFVTAWRATVPSNVRGSTTDECRPSSVRPTTHTKLFSTAAYRHLTHIGSTVNRRTSGNWRLRKSPIRNIREGRSIVAKICGRETVDCHLIHYRRLCASEWRNVICNSAHLHSHDDTGNSTRR